MHFEFTMRMKVQNDIDVQFGTPNVLITDVWFGNPDVLNGQLYLFSSAIGAAPEMTLCLIAGDDSTPTKNSRNHLAAW